MNITRYSKENVLFVSGMFAGAWLWDEIHPKIESSNINIINDPLCYLGDNVNSICDEIIDELNNIPGEISLVSNSLGSLICLMLAARLPEKINKVIISGSAGFGVVDLNIKIDRKAPEVMANKLRNRVCHFPDKVSYESCYDAAICFRDRMKNILRLTRQSNEVSANDLLSKIKGKVTAIWGDKDEITPMISAKSTLDKFKIKTHVIEHCGHSPMLDQPEQFADILNYTLASR